MTGSDLSALKDQLVARDHELLDSVDKYRLLTTKQVQRLHFDIAHPTPAAAARACIRALNRLQNLGVVKPLQRRIGGVRAGSAGFVWFVGPAGERLLRDRSLDGRSGRRNYREPSRHFVDHTLAVSELAVTSIEASRNGTFDLLRIQTEPASWQASLSRFGTAQTLKPDLRLVTASGDYEHHWFIELDLDTEHLPVIVRQCEAYHAHRATGRYQAEHGLYPAVLWVVPTEQRRRQLVRKIRTEKHLDANQFIVVTTEQIIDVLRDMATEECATQDNDPNNKQSGGQKGGTPS